MFFGVVLDVLSGLVNILRRARERARERERESQLLNFNCVVTVCTVCVLCLFLTMALVGLRSVIVYLFSLAF